MVIAVGLSKHRPGGTIHLGLTKHGKDGAVTFWQLWLTVGESRCWHIIQKSER